MKPEVIKDTQFQQNLAEAMVDWKMVMEQGLGVLEWWELVVKPGVRKLAMKTNKEINWERRGELNVLMLRQSYLARKMQCGDRSSVKVVRQTGRSK